MGLKKSKKPKHRLTHEERRDAIINEIIPLLEHKNPDLITTRDLAKAAKISEALLYQHFASKEDLFVAVQDRLCQRIPALDAAIASATPSAKSLVIYFYFIAWISLIKQDKLKIDPLFPRLMIQSLIGDKTFAALHQERRLKGLCELTSQSLKIAQEQGDIDPSVDYKAHPEQSRLAFWFGIQLLTMVYLNRLGKQNHTDYPEDNQALVDRTMEFILRGMGLSTAAINKYYDPKVLEKTLIDLIAQNHIFDTKGA